MKRLTLFLSALLASAPAQAQSLTIPALPPAAAPSTPAPATAPTVPVAPVAPTAPAAAPLAPLLLTAPVGTFAEYRIKTVSNVSLANVRFEAQPGKKISAAELKRLNAQLNESKQQLTQIFNEAANAVNGKAFARVMPNDAQGNRVLRITIIMNAVAGGAKGTAISLNQTYGSDGKLLDVKAQSDDPQLKKVYDGLNFSELLNGQTLGDAQLYGQQLMPGQPYSRSSTVNVQSLLTNVLVLGAQDDVKAEAQALKVNVVTTLLADAGGTRRYQQRTSAQPWNVSLSLGSGKDKTQMHLGLADLSGQSEQSYRPDGLPLQSSAQQSMRLNLTLLLPQEPYQLVMAANIRSQVQVVPK